MMKKIAILAILGLILTACEREEPRPVETPTAPPPATEPAPGTAVEPTQPEDEIGEAPAVEEPAAPPEAAADVPDLMTFEARNGNVPFPHQAHAAMFECSACHAQDPPAAIPDWGREVAHALCIDCHKAEGAGPVACNECHIRN